MATSNLRTDPAVPATAAELGAALGDAPGGAPTTVVGAALAGAAEPRAARARAAGVPPTPAPARPIGRPRRPLSPEARHVVGSLASLPRLARGDAPTESAAERVARRRAAARATLDLEAGAAAWPSAAVFGVGIAVGALIGAGAALLLTPSARLEARAPRGRRGPRVNTA